MKYAIIAAGEGSRLAEEGVVMPKPLVKVNGEQLIERLLRVFMQQGASSISVICNEKATMVQQRLSEIQQNGLHGMVVNLQIVVKTTPSSMHSFYELTPLLDGDEPFVLTTVDTVFKESDFSAYIETLNELARRDADRVTDFDGVMVVTDYIDDEKPLYVGVDEVQRITGFYDEPMGCRYVSGGIYGLTPKSLHTLRRCVERGEQRMRNFQRALIADGLKLKAYPFKKVLDVDHQADIAKAEAFLQKGE